MTTSIDCTQNRDPLKLVREGTSQEQRLSPALDPAYAPVEQRTVVHGIAFARQYSQYLKFFDLNNKVAGDWQPFFSEDEFALMAVAAVQDVAYYRQNVREYLDFLNDRQNENDQAGLRDRLDYLFSCCATLSIRLDLLAEKLPAKITLKKTLPTLVQSQLAPALKRLIRYRKAWFTIPGNDKPLNENNAEKAAPIEILGGFAMKFSELGDANLSKNWIIVNELKTSDWKTYYNDIKGDGSGYGTFDTPTIFKHTNHIATHNLFTSILDQFLKAYAFVVNETKRVLEAAITKWDRHEPHYALFLAYLRLFEYARSELNTLTGRHLDFYYREILQLKDKATEPGKAHLLAELAKQAPTHIFKAGEQFKAGKDDLGKPVFFAIDRDFVANKAKVAALKTVYRHGDEKVGIIAPSAMNKGRLYASPVTNSEDGLGARLTSVDQSWHPFYNKIYQEGVLTEIKMPEAEIGFAIASHYLWMAEGTRTITVTINANGYSGAIDKDLKNKITCRLTSVDGWIEKEPESFSPILSNQLKLVISLEGGDPPVTSYKAKTHGYTFDVDLPVLLVRLKHEATDAYAYSVFEDITIKSIKLDVVVEKLKTLAVSNDFGPVDTSKPFQPFGALPVAGSAFVIGSKEVFQKHLNFADVKVEWLTEPNPYNTSPKIDIDFLKDGKWQSLKIDSETVGLGSYNVFTNNLDSPDSPVVDEPDPMPNEFYSTASRHGFFRLRLDDNFGLSQYQTALIEYLKGSKVKPPGDPPVGPSIGDIWMDYKASQTIPLESADANGYNKRKAYFFHLAPFGQAEQHPHLKARIPNSEINIPDSVIYLLPQMKHLNAYDGKLQDKHVVKHEAELYIGITGLKPPQNLSLLFQVADGTANPESKKPDPHIHWSYLRGNAWIPFPENDIDDRSGGLINSGIISFVIRSDASDNNTLLPNGMHWIRGAVASGADAVCRLLMVAAQALEVTFTDKDNDPAFPAKMLPFGTISKLDQPVAAVKKITQPFASFGGRGKEAPESFYARVSERLRHKDRAIALWDYERLVLEAFPQIYRVKCLNHTHYETDGGGSGIYRELAPGHVTIVTIPNQQFQKLRDPFKPCTSLGLLKEIDAFMRQRLSCFVKLHVKNPQFEEVKVNFKVRLSEGQDESFYLNQLQKDITRFLSPWAFPGGGSPSFGGKIYKSVLIKFVEELKYVNYVTNFLLFHIFLDIDGVPQTVEKNEVEGSKALSILVSAKEHTIDPIKPAVAETSSEKCPCEA